jgi:hypothetical protein
MTNPIRDPEIAAAIQKLRANGDHFAAGIVEGVFRKNFEQGALIAELRNRIGAVIDALAPTDR